MSVVGKPDRLTRMMLIVLLAWLLVMSAILAVLWWTR